MVWLLLITVNGGTLVRKGISLFLYAASPLFAAILIHTFLIGSGILKVSFSTMHELSCSIVLVFFVVETVQLAEFIQDIVIIILLVVAIVIAVVIILRINIIVVYNLKPEVIMF
jgi:hypothetical protein